MQATHLKLVKAVEAEVSKPFQLKLTRTLELIRLWARNPQTCVSCSFGKDSMVVLYLALQFNRDIPVVFENTGVEFPETIALMRKLRDEWSLNMVELHPERHVNFWKLQDMITKRKLIRDDGRKHSNICCYHLKEKPFRVWAQGAGITRSFTGVTASESRHRMFIACTKGMEYYSFRDGFYKIHPILYWTSQEVWDFIRDNGIPVNEAYRKYGLDRIGCMWCMSHHDWRRQIANINPRVYQFIMQRYFNQKTLTDFSNGASFAAAHIPKRN